MDLFYPDLSSSIFILLVDQVLLFCSLGLSLRALRINRQKSRWQFHEVLSKKKIVHRRDMESILPLATGTIFSLLALFGIRELLKEVATATANTKKA